MTTNKPLEAALAAISIVVDDKWKPAATARGLIRGYDARWWNAANRLHVISIEETVTAPLYNIDTARPSRTWHLAGKLDKILSDGSSTILMDHKTTSMAIEEPDEPYWRQLVVDAQPAHYDLILRLLGRKVGNVMWDVIRKPAIRPKKLAKATIAAIASLHTYCGRKVSNATVEAIGCGELTSENAELYEYRVATEAVLNPDKYFQRRTAPRTDNELADYARELWQIARDIREARNRETWWRCSGACFNYGSPCDFLGICSGHDTPDSDKWTKKNSVHNELPELPDTRHYLTHSRIRCFQTCRRKHYYQYELGIERADAEQRETLYFGSLFHTALDAWWQAQGEIDGDSSSDTIGGGS